MFSSIISYLQSLLNKGEEEGQGLVEYALILILVGIVVVAVVALFGSAVTNVYCTITNTLSEAC